MNHFHLPSTCCMLLATCAASVAQAEVVSIDGTVKSVDLKKRTITVEADSKTLQYDVSRKAKISIDDGAAGLDALNPGQKVKISYHNDLEIVLKIERDDRDGHAGSSSSLEVHPLDELNSTGADLSPSLTADGLQIFWQAHSPPSTAPWIYMAHRRDANSTFTARTKLFRGRTPVVSANGLELYIFSVDTERVKTATRSETTERFRRLRSVRELKFRGFPSGISRDGLTMYLDIHDPEYKVAGPAHAVTRANASSPWGKPIPLPIDLLDKRIQINAIHSVSPVDDRGLAVLCNLDFNIDKERNVKGGVLSRESPEGKFTKWEEVPLSNSDGINAGYFAPRYVPATKELFVQSYKLFANEEAAKRRGVDLWVVTGFEPPIP